MYHADAASDAKFEFMNIFKQGVFWAVHLACFAALWVGVSWVAVAVCLGLYFIRMFAITGIYHRYFSHRSYQTSRVVQFLFALLGTTAAQKGPIWWASHHRHHHRHSDTEEDIHSPIVHGIYFAHVGWVLSSQFLEPRLELVKDLTKYPELRTLEKYNLVPPVLLGVATFFLGTWLQSAYPQLGTSGPQMLVWGFFISTVLLYHGTFCINSFTHLIGKRRFPSTDHSRNNLFLALITLGEGWHNNHHYYPGSERQGFYWWEIDISHYILTMMSWLGLVWDLRVPPPRVYEAAGKLS
jgi:stearoyl-CoA desaturase (delta-9 desaturase)